MEAKTLFIALGAAAVGTLAYAYTQTVEIMTVEFQDGQKVEYKIDDVAKVSFDSRKETIGFSITDANSSEIYRSESIDPMFRMVPEDDAAPTTFIFGTAENAVELADLKAGRYMVLVEINNSALFQPEVNLAEENSGVVLQLYEWAEGEISVTRGSISEGVLTTSRNAHGVFTMELDAKFDDGMYIRGSYSGMPTDVTDLEVLFPTPGPKNEVCYYNNDGVLLNTAKIIGFKKSIIKSSGPMGGAASYTAILDDDHSDVKCEIQIVADYIGQNIDFATIEKSDKPVCYFRYDHIQIYTNNDYAGMSGTEGNVEIVEGEDGTITVKADVTNKYVNWGMNGGTPERVTIEYTGACEGLEVAPKNNVEYYGSDGDLMRTVSIEGFTKKVSGNGNLKYVATLGGDDEYTKCEIEMKPELLGQLIDFAEYTEKPADGASLFSFRFDDVQLASPNDQWKNQGLKGTMQVVENGDGTVTVKADVVNKYIQGGTTMEGGNAVRVVLEYKGDCSGL